MENKMTVRPETTPTTRCGAQPAPINQFRPYPVYDEKQTGKLIDEVIAAAKDDRMNTKRCISADIAATARVQNQNERVIEACERELRRKDLPEERREEVLGIMSRAAESSAYESAASREYQKEQLEHSHKLPWKILGWGAVANAPEHIRTIKYFANVLYNKETKKRFSDICTTDIGRKSNDFRWWTAHQDDMFHIGDLRNECCHSGNVFTRQKLESLIH